MELNLPARRPNPWMLNKGDPILVAILCFFKGSPTPNFSDFRDDESVVPLKKEDSKISCNFIFKLTTCDYLRGCALGTVLGLVGSTDLG